MELTTQQLAAKIRAYLDGVIAAADAARPRYEKNARAALVHASEADVAAFIALSRTASPQMTRALLAALNSVLSFQRVYDAPEMRDMAEVVVREMARGLELLEANDDTN